MKKAMRSFAGFVVAGAILYFLSLVGLNPGGLLRRGMTAPKQQPQQQAQQPPSSSDTDGALCRLYRERLANPETLKRWASDYVEFQRQYVRKNCQ